MSKKQRPYDIILIGATGFTGQLTADYLLKQPHPIRLALAGRNSDKLLQVRELLLADNPHATAPDLLLADSHNMASLRELCSQTHVVISTVGPYALHGEDLVAACITQGCDYVDLTGEPQFVSRMQQTYHHDAQHQNVKIVHCCGFDSIPHDLGVYFTLQTLCQSLGDAVLEQSQVEIAAYVRGHGDISGGTWNSAIEAMPNWQAFIKERRRLHHQTCQGRDIYLHEIPKLQKLKDGWAAPLPTIDPAIVVQSAKRYAYYGKQFRYAHYAVVPQLHRLALASAAVAGIFTVAQFAKGREWLGKRRPSGAGPVAEERAKHWFTVEFQAQVITANKEQHTLRTLVSGGDPGYDETAKMLAESALCLLLDKDVLPKHYGIVTPAEGMGTALLSRLQAAGIRFEEK
ncbi:saccharopine dehydrogenase family protein [Agitococcus lubricus]|uniref:Short subunit dehydrogenase-like uncharacterized protein n=1 Tax=Agitococcus lubricus TaxID=1077255 RepID=A0A2T5IZ37_9GAMM|nr:saccharopine dehydrogenase NADP-binding domain-containing protein [Agitococcus lubricus]PTQ89284.1 short subunit dehydrogenase-like uncharacterized protein [Agitococcus lubricus]